MLKIIKGIQQTLPYWGVLLYPLVLFMILIGILGFVILNLIKKDDQQ